MKPVFIIGIILIAPIMVACQPGQTTDSADQDNLMEARIAFDKFNDCGGAKRALDKVSTISRNNIMFVRYSAKTYECLSTLDSAIVFYTKLMEISADSSIKEKIIELNYLINKKQFELKNCSLCRGTGFKEVDKPCSLCQETGKKEERCDECRGTGSYSDYCGGCGGMGYVRNTSISCPICNGKGLLKSNCINCDGKGSITRRCTKCDGLGEFSKKVPCQH